MIEIKGVSKKYKNETAIIYKDLVFEDGKSYMLLGASGCGKSTLLNMMAGILSPDTGDIIIDGDIVSKKKSKGKRQIPHRKNRLYFSGFQAHGGNERLR